MSDPITIDTKYTGRDELAAAYLVIDSGKAAFVDTNTAHALPLMLGALSDAGLSPEDVEYVIITHVHLDHAGGAPALMEACPNATLLAHPRAAPHMIDPSKLVASAKQVYGEQSFMELYGELGRVPESRVRVMEDGEELAFGERNLTFLYTRGHANHHFSIYDDRADAVYAGDAFGLVYPWAQGDGDDVFAIISASPTDFDAAAAHEALDIIRGTGCETVYLGHFGATTALEEVAGMLGKQLDAYASMIERADQSDVSNEDLDAFMKREVDAMFAGLFERFPAAERMREGLSLDMKLNADGVAFALKKIRFKRSRAS